MQRFKISQMFDLWYQGVSVTSELDKAESVLLVCQGDAMYVHDRLKRTFRVA
jgi:hypothetical protein